MIESPVKFHHVGVVVQDLEASVAWYARHFGFERTLSFSFPNTKAAFVRRGDLCIEFFQHKHAAPMARERQSGEQNIRIGGINHFAMEVPDIDAAIAELERQGVEIVSRPKDVPGDRGERYAFVHDNENMLVELFQSGT